MINGSEYFLAIGAGRGGTSLLAAMMDCHPNIIVGFERFAFDYLLGKKLGKETKDNLKERLLAFDHACKSEADRSDEIWGNKITTEQIEVLNECVSHKEEVLSNFVKTVVKKQKVVFILRDGRYCVQSKINRTGQDYQIALNRWKYSVEVLNYFKTKNVDLHALRYEDLLLNPEDELTQVCEFLGCEFDIKMLEGPQNRKMPDMYLGNTLRQVPTISEEQERWTLDMKKELKQLGYLYEN